MQEKTLEEEFRKKFTKITAHGLETWNLFGEPPAVLAFMSSREEKAREEGRAQGIIDIAFKFKESEIINNAITQYKEELSGKLPGGRHTNWNEVVHESYDRGWNDCLSEIKKLIK